MSEQCAIEEATTGVKNFGWSSLSVVFHSEFVHEGVCLNICQATISTQEMQVFDAWVIVGGGHVNVFNIDHFPSINSAAAYHIGKLVLEGYLRIVTE